MRAKTRLIMHSIFGLSAAGIGMLAFSYYIFPLVFIESVKPVAPLIGMAFGLFFVGISGLAGLGFWLIVDILRGEIVIQKVPEERLVDLVAGTQYLLIGMLLVLGNFFAN